eukprot:4301450-Pyramimonas_sp.AAC.1
MPKCSARYCEKLYELYEVLAAPRAGIPLAHRCQRALRGSRHRSQGASGGFEGPPGELRGTRKKTPFGTRGQLKQ